MLQTTISTGNLRAPFTSDIWNYISGEIHAKVACILVWTMIRCHLKCILKYPMKVLINCGVIYIIFIKEFLSTAPTSNGKHSYCLLHSQISRIMPSVRLFKSILLNRLDHCHNCCSLWLRRYPYANSLRNIRLTIRISIICCKDILLSCKIGIYQIDQNTREIYQWARGVANLARIIRHDLLYGYYALNIYPIIHIDAFKTTTYPVHRLS